MQIDGRDGSVLDWLHDPAGAHVRTVSAAVEHGGRLFLGNLAGERSPHWVLSVPNAAGAHPLDCEAEARPRARCALVLLCCCCLRPPAACCCGIDHWLTLLLAAQATQSATLT